MTRLFLDCFSGISGDMLLGAFVDLGVPVDWLKANVMRLPLSDFDIVAENMTTHGIQAVKVDVKSLDHRTHRHYGDIRALVADSPLAPQTKKTCLNIFERLAEAEAHIHGCSKEAVHFHEVGAVDAIVDIVGTSLCLQYLGVEQVVCSALPMGRGFVHCQHGVLPLPAPATMAILKGVPVYGSKQEKELVTPTGAAVVASIADRFDVMPGMRIDAVGYGAGTHELEGQPNLLRVVKGTAESASDGMVSEKLVMIETTIDDMNPELYGYLMEKLLAEGALDVIWIPVYMKKNRPGTLIHVLCPKEKRSAVVERILLETTSLGVRYHEVERSALARENVEIETEFGTMAAKQVRGVDGAVRIVPEYEACRRVAVSLNMPLRSVYESVARDHRKRCD